MKSLLTTVVILVALFIGGCNQAPAPQQGQPGPAGSSGQQGAQGASAQNTTQKQLHVDV